MQRIYLSITFLAGLWCTTDVHAQTCRVDTLNAFVDGRLPEMFRLTHNPATLWQSVMPDYTRVAVGWRHVSGDLRRPMDAQTSNSFATAATGFAKVSNWTFQGSAEYGKKLENEVAWSGVYDPYDGSPFLWTDSSRGDWERDHLKVSAGINTPALSDRWHAGLNIAYHIGSGARKSDPKPFYRYRNISLTPGLTWSAGKHVTIGAYGKVQFVQEDNELGFYNTGTGNVLLYRLRGYGTYTRAPFVSAERQRSGASYEAGAHYSYEKGRVLSIINIYGGVNNETVYEGVVKRQAYGNYTANSYGGAASFYYTGIDKGRFGAISFDAVSGYADDVEYNAQTAYSTEYRITAKVGSWKGGLLWELRPFIYYNGFSDVATATDFNAASAGGLFVLSWKKPLSHKASLQLKPAAGYRYVLQNSWQQGVDNIIIRELILPDYNYFSTSRMLASVTCTYMLLTGHEIAQEIEVHAGMQHATELSNKTISLKYSIIF